MAVLSSSQDAEKMFKDAPDTLAFRALEKQWKLLKEGLAQDLIERWEEGCRCCVALVDGCWFCVMQAPG